MSQRKPPDDEATRDDVDEDRVTAPRSQQRPAPAWGLTKPLDGEGLGGRPTPMRPEPGRAFGRDGVPEEPTVRVARSVVAGAPSAHEEVTRAAPRPQPNAPGRPAPTNAERTHLLGSEPLAGAPSQPRPTPAVRQQVSAKATLLMTEAAPPPRSGAAPAASRQKEPAPARKAEESGRVQAPAGMSADRHPGATLSQQQADIPHLSEPPGPTRPKRSAPAPTSNRSAGPKSVRMPQGTMPVPDSALDGESLRLQLDEGDMLEQPVDAAGGSHGVPQRGNGLVIGIVVAVAIAAGAGIWYGMSSHSTPAAELPPTRNETELSPTAPNAAVPGAAPTAPAAVPAGENAQPAARQPSAAPSAVPAQAAAQPAAQQPSAEPSREPEAAKPATAAPSRAPARRPKRRAGGGAAIPGEASEDVAAAREALRDLESGPVIKVQPSEDEPPSSDDSPLAPPEPPEPPPPAPE